LKASLDSVNDIKQRFKRPMSVVAVLATLNKSVKK